MQRTITRTVVTTTTTTWTITWRDDATEQSHAEDEPLAPDAPSGAPLSIRRMPRRAPKQRRTE